MGPITIRRSVAAIALAIVPLAAACSSTSEQVSDEIAPQVQEQLELAAEPTVTCPDDAEAKEGSTFECTVDLEGTEVPLNVEFTSDTTFVSNVKGAVFQKDVLHTNIEDQFTAQEITLASIECPGEELVIILADETVDCAVESSDGEKATVVVTADDAGNAEIKEVIEE